MNAIQTFSDKLAAQSEADKMQGWDTKTVKLQIADPEAENAMADLLDVFAIECDGSAYLRENGYVE